MFVHYRIELAQVLMEQHDLSGLDILIDWFASPAAAQERDQANRATLLNWFHSRTRQYGVVGSFEEQCAEMVERYKKCRPYLNWMDRYGERGFGTDEDGIVLHLYVDFSRFSGRA